MVPGVYNAHLSLKEAFFVSVSLSLSLGLGLGVGTGGTIYSALTMSGGLALGFVVCAPYYVSSSFPCRGDECTINTVVASSTRQQDAAVATAAGLVSLDVLLSLLVCCALIPLSPVKPVTYHQDIILTTYVIWERESSGDDRTFLKRCGMKRAAEAEAEGGGWGGRFVCAVLRSMELR